MMRKPRTRSAAAIVERVLLFVGILLLGIVSAAYIHRAVMVHRSVHNFEVARHEHVSAMPVNNTVLATDETTSPENRVDARRDLKPREISSFAVPEESVVPLAILRIPKIHLAVPVLTGTDEITLNRGVGQIAGTAAPGENGNIGIAGHRDSFFRNLKDIKQGDVIELETTNTSATYIVEHILITGPNDTNVLQPSGEPTLTLVTCYPFHFIGPAPRRFVVQASLK